MAVEILTAEEAKETFPMEKRSTTVEVKAWDGCGLITLEMYREEKLLGVACVKPDLAEYIATLLTNAVKASQLARCVGTA